MELGQSMELGQFTTAEKIHPVLFKPLNDILLHLNIYQTYASKRVNSVLKKYVVFKAKCSFIMDGEISEFFIHSRYM